MKVMIQDILCMCGLPIAFGIPALGVIDNLRLNDFIKLLCHLQTQTMPKNTPPEHDEGYKAGSLTLPGAVGMGTGVGLRRGRARCLLWVKGGSDPVILAFAAGGLLVIFIGKWFYLAHRSENELSETSPT